MTATQESLIRLGVFLGTLAVMASWESLAPRRAWTLGKPRRWLTNLGLAAINGLVWRLLLPAGAVGIALAVQERGWGLVSWSWLPSGVVIAASVVLLDLAIYWQHWAFHRIPWLWRLHLVHHVDLDFDTTTGVRFHTVETLLSFAWKGAVIALLGTPPLAVMIFEVLLNATSLFNHGNVRLPLSLDRVLGCLLVTPDMHRVHHSVEDRETNSNYGFCLPWWDFLFRTYRSRPAAGQDGLVIGRPEYRTADTARLRFLLCLPFRRERPPSPCLPTRPPTPDIETQSSISPP